MSTPEILISIGVGLVVLYGAYRVWKRRDRSSSGGFGGGGGGKNPPTHQK